LRGYINEEETWLWGHMKRQATLLDSLIGLKVEVISGRKVPIGTEGTVGELMVVAFGGKGHLDVMIITKTGEEYWTNINNVGLAEAVKIRPGFVEV